MAVLNRRTLLRALAWTAPTLAIGGLVPVANADEKPKRRSRFMPKVYGTPIIGGLDPMGPSPLTLLRDNTDVLIDNTIAETTLFTYTIPAYTLDGDRGLRVRIDTAWKNFSGSGLSFILRVYLGATVLWQDTQSSLGSADVVSPYSFTLELMAKNSDAAQELFGNVWVGHRSNPDVGEGAINGGVHFNIYGDSAEDGTTDLDLVVTVEMGAADPEAWWLHRRSIVELL